MSSQSTTDKKVAPNRFYSEDDIDALFEKLEEVEDPLHIKPENGGNK